MKCVATETGFYKGKRIRAGESFDFEGATPGKWMVPAESAPVQVAEDSDEKAPGLTAQEIRIQLENAGVKYNVRATKPELLALLEETVKAMAPASSGAADKSASIIV